MHRDPQHDAPPVWRERQNGRTGRITRTLLTPANETTIGRLFSGQGAAQSVTIHEQSGDTVTYTVADRTEAAG